MRIAIIGAGAIGSIIGGLLARAGEDVMLIGRQPHVDIINKQGLIIDGGLGHMVVKVQAAEKLTFRPDLALITVKTQDITAAVQENKTLLQDVPVITVQNGVQADHLAAGVLGKENILSCVVLFGGTFLEAGKVTYAPVGKMVLGEAFSTHTQRARQLADVLSKAIPTTITDNIQGAHWTKLIINEVNALPAITGMSIQEIQQYALLQKLTVLMMREAIDVVKSNGITFLPLPGAPIHIIDRLVHLPMPIARIVPKMAARAMGKTPAPGSTLQSIKRGEKTEIDYLNGEIVALGKKLNKSTPYNTKIVELVHQVEDTGSFVKIDRLQAQIRAMLS